MAATPQCCAALYAPARDIHKDWTKLNCMHICKGSAQVDAGQRLWVCTGCERMWHPSCARQDQDIEPGDEPAFQ